MESTIIKEETISKREALEILKIKNHTLSNLTKSNKIIEINKELTLSSVLKYKKELEERREVNKPIWINNGGYGSI
jgi:hypothetical protein